MNSSNTTAVPQLTLTEAIIDTINELKVGGSLSAYEITSAIRKDANAGDIALPGLEAKANPAGIKYWVNHEAVKTIIDGLLADGTLANLGLTNTHFNGTYRVFEFGTVQAAPTPVPNTAAVIVPTNPTTATVSPVIQRINSYLANNPGVVTLKQIQSAVRVNGLSCKDFYDILTGAGYIVSVGTADKFSTYTVG